MDKENVGREEAIAGPEFLQRKDMMERNCLEAAFA